MEICCLCKIVYVGEKHQICYTCMNKQDKFIKKGKDNMRKGGS